MNETRPASGASNSTPRFAKSDDDVGFKRAMREQQARKNCGEVTIGHPKIRASPYALFVRVRK
jgi:hypothetical protein